jgi:hypothetical protein
VGLVDCSWYFLLEVVCGYLFCGTKDIGNIEPVLLLHRIENKKGATPFKRLPLV